jgi:hypothetical protein
MQPNFERLQRQANREGAAWRASMERQHTLRLYGKKTIIEKNKEYLMSENE